MSNDLYETENFKEVGGVGEPISVGTHCMEVGHRLGDFWGLKSVGVDKDGFVLVQVSDGNGGWNVKPFNTNLNKEENRQRLEMACLRYMPDGEIHSVIKVST